VFVVVQNIVIFSLAAPVTAVATYILLNMGVFDASQQALIGLCLLWSAGSFLYVATIHILPEVTGGEGIASLDYSSVLVLVAGILLPLLLNLNHEHAHGH